jgi:hypothetical protein
VSGNWFAGLQQTLIINMEIGIWKKVGREGTHIDDAFNVVHVGFVVLAPHWLICLPNEWDSGDVRAESREGVQNLELVERSELRNLGCPNHIEAPEYDHLRGTSKPLLYDLPGRGALK